MFNPPTLTHQILSRESIESLHRSYTQRLIGEIEREIERRLISCDPDLYLPVIEFLYTNQNNATVVQWLKSPYIIQGLYGTLNCIPWKIGVLYDYRDQSYRVNNVMIILGRERFYHERNGRRFKPTWLSSKQRKLVLREVISQNNRPFPHPMSVVTTNPQLDDNVRNMLVYNDVVTISICNFIPVIGTTYNTYLESQGLPGGELKQMYPCRIQVGDTHHDLITVPGGNINAFNPTPYNVQIIKTNEVLKLFHLIRLTN